MTSLTVKQKLPTVSHTDAGATKYYGHGYRQGEIVRAVCRNWITKKSFGYLVPLGDQVKQPLLFAHADNVDGGVLIKVSATSFLL